MIRACDFLQRSAFSFSGQPMLEGLRSPIATATHTAPGRQWQDALVTVHLCNLKTLLPAVAYIQKAQRAESSTWCCLLQKGYQHRVLWEDHMQPSHLAGENLTPFYILLGAVLPPFPFESQQPSSPSFAWSTNLLANKLMQMKQSLLESFLWFAGHPPSSVWRQRQCSALY